MIKRSNFLLIALALTSFGTCPAGAQSEQSIFQDERQMVHDEGSQIQNYQNAVTNYQQQVTAHDDANEPYRLYAQKTIQQLQKFRAANGSPALSVARQDQLYALEKWLRNDTQVRDQEKAHIQQLDKAIANLQRQQNATFSDLGSDINAMRENQEAKAEDTKFDQMMRINQFNELQSEMGACSWGRPPTDGTYNSVGGYGMNGGYGYSLGGGRRWW